MKITQEDLPHREALLKIELEDQDLEPYLDKAYRRVVQRANIPGFRKGKAPRRVVEQLFGRDYLMNEAMEFLVPEVTSAAVAQQELEIGGIPRVSMEQFDPVVIEAKVPLEPEVDLGAYLDLRIAEDPVAVEKEQLERVLVQLREGMAVWEPVDLAAGFGDLVNLDVRGEADGKEVAQSSGVDYLLQEGLQRPLPGFSEALEGIKAGESKEFTIDLPAEFEDSQLQGKSCLFKVKALAVKRKQLPELNDDFAKSVGEGYENLKGLRAKIKEDVKRQAEEEARRDYEEKALQALIDGSKFDVSPLIFENATEQLLKDQAEALRQQRVTMEQYLSTVGKTQEQMEEELRPKAEIRVRRGLALKKVSQLEQIQVSEKEVEEEVESMAAGSPQGKDSVRQMFGSPEGQESLRRMLTARKTLARLADIARAGVSGEMSAKVE